MSSPDQTMLATGPGATGLLDGPGSDPDTGSGSAPDTPVPGRIASSRENALTLFGGVWLIAGLFVDGYAHSEIIDTETEDFFTPWHAIFYSGFLFVTAVIGWIWLRRAGEGPPARWLPAGYGWSAVGLLIFAVGGVGDGIWHTIFGVENGIDALLSPTHLLLFVGMALIVTTPLRSFWLDPNRRATWSDAGGAIASTAIATALTAFFFVYNFGLGENWTHELPFDPITEQNEEFVELGLATGYVATVILVVPLVALMRRTDLPAGSALLIWLIPSIATTYAFGGEFVAVPASAAGALTVELMFAGLRNRLGRRAAAVTAIGAGTLVMWSVWMAWTHAVEGVAWMPELWSGQIVMSTVLAVAVALLAFAPTPTVAQAPAQGQDQDPALASASG